MHKLLNWKLLLLPFIFFIVSIFLIKDYGISWDEPIHFYRGHAYMHYFLTGEKTFDSLPKVIEHQRAREEEDYSAQGFISKSENRKSYYQDNSLNMEYFLENDAGHPPLNGILAAFSNYIFYQKLGLMGDLYSHHVFNIAASTLLVFIVGAFAYQVSGGFTAIIATLSLITYPLFFAESQFNIKDPPQAAFFSLCLWAFWNSTKKASWKWLLLAIIAAGLSFGMKFNILFLPFIVVPFLLVKYFPLLKQKPTEWLKTITKVPRVYLCLLLLAPIIVAAIFVLPWPYLWPDPFSNFLKIFGYYKEIGSGNEGQYAYMDFGPFNLYPIFWIVITTPPVVLLLSFIGALVALSKFKKSKHKAEVLWLLWFLIPIARVTIPGSSIYGGVRQIVEYIPAMALLAGLGASYILGHSKIVIKIAGVVFIFLGFIIGTFTIIKYHPNQNVYFNFLVGGLAGAQEKKIPYYGNSFGNAYWQAIQWLNENGEQDAKLGLIQGTGLNIPQEMLRSDIQYGNSFWTGNFKGGEYLLELTHDDPVKIYQYAWDYVDTFLNPVYEVKVDGVPIAKLWKNDLAHTKEKYRKEELTHTKDIKTEVIESSLVVTLPKELNITRLSIDFVKNQSCVSVAGYVSTSIDGISWVNYSESIPSPQLSGELSLNETQTNFFFAAKKAKFVRFTANSPESCIFQKTQVKIYSLDIK